MRIIAIVVFIALAFMLFRYRTNEKIRKGTVIVLLALFLLYSAIVVITELMR